MQSMFEEIS